MICKALGRPDKSGRPGQANNLAPHSNRNSLNFFSSYDSAGENFRRRVSEIFGQLVSRVQVWVCRPHTADYSSDLLVSPYRFGTPGGCPAGPPLRPTLESEMNANSTYSSNHCVCRSVRKISKSDNHLRRVCLSIRPSVWNKWARPGRIFIKYDVRTFFENM